MEEEEQQESSPTAQALKSRHSIRCASSLFFIIKTAVLVAVTLLLK